MRNQVFAGTTPRLGLIVTENNAPLDISAATAKQLVFKKASGALVTVAAVFTTNGTDGKIHYVAPAGFLAAGEVGKWSMQGLITLPDSAVPWSTDIVNFWVQPNLQ